MAVKVGGSDSKEKPKLAEAPHRHENAARMLCIADYTHDVRWCLGYRKNVLGDLEGKVEGNVDGGVSITPQQKLLGRATRWAVEAFSAEPFQHKSCLKQ